MAIEERARQIRKDGTPIPGTEESYLLNPGQKFELDSGRFGFGRRHARVDHIGSVTVKGEYLGATMVQTRTGEAVNELRGIVRRGRGRDRVTYEVELNYVKLPGEFPVSSTRHDSAIGDFFAYARTEED